MAAAAWGMDNFNEYLKDLKFTLYMDQTTEQNLGTTQVKMLNRLKTAMSEHNFYTRNRQRSNIPDFLKQRQTNTNTRHIDYVMHVETHDLKQEGQTT
jgi:hypothetical protein